MRERDTDEQAGHNVTDPEDAALAADAAKEKEQAEAAEAEARRAQEQAEKAETDAESKAEEKSEEPEAEESEGTDESKVEASEETEAEEPEEEEEPEETVHVARLKPQLDEATRDLLRKRAEESDQRPPFRRHEWFRYLKLGDRHAPWRRPYGMHSKQRRHYKYRPQVVSVGHRGPAAVRGLHPSGFEEVPVHRPEDLEAIDAKTQAARIGRTVGGRKAEAIAKRADELGIRILNRRL